jgi:hypothetical protein
VELTVYAEANQFILFGGAESSADEDGEVSNAELAAHVAARLSTLVVFTASYGVVSVCFESSPSEPAVSPGMNHVRIAWDNIASGDAVLAEEPLERLTVRVWPGKATAPRVLRWYEGWRPRPAPTNPHGLWVLAGPDIGDHSGMRAIGECPRSDGSSTVLIVDADGVYWQQDYRTEPPYDEILFELPESELHRFELD